MLLVPMKLVFVARVINMGPVTCGDLESLEKLTVSVVLPLSQKQNQRPLDLAAFNSGPMTEYQANGPQVVLQEKKSYSTQTCYKKASECQQVLPPCANKLLLIFLTTRVEETCFHLMSDGLYL